VPDFPAGANSRRRVRRARTLFAVLATGLLAVAIGGSTSAGRAETQARTTLGLPVDCRLGEECFVQQMPDIDPLGGILDPLCGNASYRGHDGWDIRLRSLKDIGRTAVLSVADGTVLRVRDGIPDRIFDRSLVSDLLGGKECGNGVVVEHAYGIVSQYCHLKQGSVAVRPGTRIGKGQSLGSIGASGLAEFPHVHLSIRRDGITVEPLTGRPLRQGAEACGDTTNGLFEPSVERLLSKSPTAILDLGLAKAPPELANLVREGGPPLVKLSEPIVVWVWAINVEQGSLFRIQLLDPDRTPILDVETRALEGRKANYLAYVGGKHGTRAGVYELRVELLAGSRTVQSTSRSFELWR
jgi:murein DD-endopeptidase MepM/ murein hydrolase activator NlpD